ncbi:RHS repeat-associated core domain-containing protein [Streptomyces aidingensis]|uniref:RHS repeat-associated core domain-containing protein n=2 Tax=Streptomyces aidingensis TaxID=910347 RepID=A0A1I1SAQ9_9ACTN|nr:RHS repeat-associated core domain-containing protein [Streptomyces aidingensis]SFD43422.1 RHS repeat-associated core domain-containing protein [Streptomyces aidingensis]
MGRASDWSPLDMDSDPTPGDPSRIEQLGNKFTTFADDVYDALQKVRALGEDGTLAAFVGESADSYRDKFDKVPPNLEKLHTSYDLAGQALLTYAPKLEDAQRDADQALTDAEDARAELATAQSWLERATSALEDAEEEAEPPDEEEVSAEVRRALADAQLDAGNAQTAVDDAREKLNAAIALAQQAKEAREEAAERCKRDLEEASDAGMQNKKWWQKAVDWVVDNWDTIVNVCKIIVAVVGIIAMIIGGPLALLVLAAALIVLADTLIKYANGEASLWDVAFAALDCIPGMKGLTTAAGLLKGVKSGLKGLKQGVKGLGRTLRRNGRPVEVKVCKTDPIDMATGEMVMDSVDVDLTGVLPLRIERHHISSYADGRSFGRSWASTLDQRLVLDDSGAQFFSADGMVLDYPVPLPDPRLPVLPVEGPRWELSWDGRPGGAMSVRRRDTHQNLHFAAVDGVPSHHLPLVAMTDLNGNRITFHYESGVLTEIRHSGGYRLGVSVYDDRVTALRLLSDPAEPVLIAYDYDDAGNLSKVYNSSGLPSLLFYDDRHRITGWQDRNGNWYRYTYDAEGRCVATEGVDSFLSSRIEYETEHGRTVFTDSLGHTTVFQFNDCYQLVAETDPTGATTRYEYDRFDRPLRVTDPLGRNTSYAYDAEGNLTAVTRPDGTVFAAEYNELGLPVVITEPDGSQWHQTYDDAGNQISVTDPAGGVTRYAFGPGGGLTRATNAAGETTEVRCDSAGLPVWARTASGAETHYRRDAMGRPAEIVHPSGAVSRIEWSTEGKVTRQEDPEGGVQRWEWDPEGNNTRHTDAAGNTTRFEYGAFDLLRRRIDPDGAVYSFAHDTELNTTRITNPQGLSWDYRRDPLGRLTGERDYNGRSIIYRRNAAGELTETVNPLGELTRYLRDKLGQVVAKDAAGVLTEYRRDPAGRIVRAIGPDAELVLERDGLGQIVAETCNGRALRTAFDALGRPVRRITPAGIEVRWEHDPSRRQRRLTAAGRTLTFALDAGGREVSRLADEEALLTQDWDAAGRLTRQTLPVTGVAKTFSYRPDHVLSGVHDSRSGDTAYTLDPLGRVTRVDGSNWSEEYTYDRTGSQTGAHWTAEGTAHTDSIGERAHQQAAIASAGRVSFDYDAAGRVIARRTRTLSGTTRTVRYVWDADDQLREIRLPDGSRWLYRYDPLGRRIEKQHLAADGTPGPRTLFTWDGTRLAEQSTQHPGSPDTTTTAWEYDPETENPVAQLEHRARSSALTPPQGTEDIRLYSVITDFVGTPTRLVDASGTIAWELNTTVWGVPRSDTRKATACPLRFPGQYYDDESGLHYNYHRYYDPDVARYLSPDPLGLTAGPHHYNYVPNPFLWIDPLGLACTVVRHFTTKRSYQQIMSGGGKGKILLKASKPGKGHPEGVYLTPLSPADIAKKKGGFKSYLGITREKSEYMIEFKMDGDLLQGIRGGRGDHVVYSPKDLEIPHENISYHGPTADWTAS